MTTTDHTAEPPATFDAARDTWEAREADPDGTVEKVARALWESEPYPRSYGWDDIVPAAQERYQRLALAAINALKAPAPVADPAGWDARVEAAARGMWEANRGHVSYDWTAVVESAQQSYRRLAAAALTADATHGTSR